jgi:hypothetical protein
MASSQTTLNDLGALLCKVKKAIQKHAPRLSKGAEDEPKEGVESAQRLHFWIDADACADDASLCHYVAAVVLAHWMETHQPSQQLAKVQAVVLLDSAPPQFPRMFNERVQPLNGRCSQQASEFADWQRHLHIDQYIPDLFQYHQPSPDTLRCLMAAVSKRAKDRDQWPIAVAIIDLTGSMLHPSEDDNPLREAYPANVQFLAASTVRKALGDAPEIDALAYFEQHLLHPQLQSFRTPQPRTFCPEAWWVDACFRSPAEQPLSPQ